MAPDIWTLLDPTEIRLPQRPRPDPGLPAHPL